MTFSLGYKCPNCGSSNLAPQPIRPRICVFLGAQLHECTICHRDIAYFCLISILVDKRAAKRYRTASTLLVRLRDKKEQFGRLLDISTGGLSFSYDFDQQKFADQYFRLDIFNCRDGSYLEGLPVRIVSNTVQVKTISGRPVTILRNSASFEHLSRHQLSVLKKLISECPQGA